MQYVAQLQGACQYSVTRTCIARRGIVILVACSNLHHAMITHVHQFFVCFFCFASCLIITNDVVITLLVSYLAGPPGFLAELGVDTSLWRRGMM